MLHAVFLPFSYLSFISSLLQVSAIIVLILQMKKELHDMPKIIQWEALGTFLFARLIIQFNNSNPRW